MRKGGEAFALTWSKDVLSKVQQFPYPAAHSYRQDLASELIRLPGSSEAVVIRVRAGTPRLVRDVFWIDGAPVAALPISRELLAAGTATVPRQTMALQACTFSDTAGHAFEGHARRPETIEAADQVRAELRGDHEVELVRVTINRGAGCPNLDGVVTGIERLAVDVERMTADARTHFDRRIAREGTSIRDQLYKLRRTLPRTSSRRDQGPMPLVSEAMYRWNAATRQLRITMLHKRGAWGYYIYESVEVATKGIPVHKEKPRPDEMILDYAIELATEYEYDRAGTLLHERDHPVRALHEQLRAFGAPKMTHLEWDYP